MLTVGIDIGTSYSSISILDSDKKAQPVKVANGACMFGDSFSMPSAVFVEDNGEIRIGQLAMSGKMKNPSSFKGEFKRDLGQDIPYNLGPLQLLPEDLYKEIFIYFKKCAQEAGGDKIGKTYITYPANFSQKKCKLIELAAKNAGLLDLEMIDEPTAAAYCYCAKGKINDGDILLVYDFGGGTFDVALITYENGGFIPITDALGIERCGGMDIDRMIFEDIMACIPVQSVEMIKNNEMALKRLYSQIMELSVKIKHQLSATDCYKDAIQIGFDFIDYELSADKLNGIVAPLVDQTMIKVEDIVHNAGIDMKDISAVLLVGGTSRIPYIKEKLQKLTGQIVSKDIDPELAVCMGAALWTQKAAEEENGAARSEDMRENKPGAAESKDTGGNTPGITEFEGMQDDELLLIPIEEKGKRGYINTDGHMVIQPMYDIAEDFSEGIALIGLNGKYGYTDRTGRVIVEPQYDCAGAFSEGIAPVKTGEIWGYIDADGNIVIKPEYSTANGISDGMARVMVNGKYGYINKAGDMVIGPIYDDAYDFSDGMARVQLNGRYCYVDKTGKIVIGPVYQDVGAFSEGLVLIKVNTRSGYSNKAGSFLTRSVNEVCNFAEGFVQGIAESMRGGSIWSTAWSLGDKVGFVDKAGNMVIQPLFDNAMAFSDGLATVKVKGKWGFIDQTGRMVIGPVYKNAGSFADGLAVVNIDGRDGYINKSGNIVIPPLYEAGWSFNDGLASVALNGRFGVINKNNAFVVPPLIDSLFSICIYKDGYIKYTLNGKLLVADRNGKEIWHSQ